MNVVNKGVLDCDKPHAFAEGMTYPSITSVDSKGHRKDLSVYPKKKKNIAMIFLLQDNSSGNVSEGDCATDNQEDSFQGRQKTRDKSATPRKDGSKRSVLPKSVPGYKVEEKSP